MRNGLGFLKGYGVGCEDAFSFLYDDGLIGCQVFEGVFVTAGPGYGKAHFSAGVGFAQTEGYGQLTL